LKIIEGKSRLKVLKGRDLSFPLFSPWLESSAWRSG
jgi:hypothetical protein